MFNGKVRERVVRISGQKKEQEKNQFIENTRKQREERKLERLRIDSAIKIQSTIRGWLTRKQFLSRLRLSFDAELRKIDTLKAVFASRKATFNVPIAIVLTLLRSVNIFFKLDTDTDRLYQIRRLLSESLSHTDTNFNFLSLATGNDIQAIITFQYQINIFCQHAISLLIDIPFQRTTTQWKEYLLCFDSLISFPQNQYIQTLINTNTNIQKHTNYIQRGTSRLMIKHFICTYFRILSSRRETGSSGSTNVLECDRALMTLMVKVLLIGLSDEICNGSLGIAILGCNSNDIEESWRIFTTQVLSIPNLAAAAAAEPILSFLNENNGAGWRHALHIAAASTSITTTTNPVQTAHKSTVPDASIPTTSATTTSDPTTGYLHTIHLLGNFSLCLCLSNSGSGLSALSSDTVWLWISLFSSALDEIPLVSLLNYMDTSDHIDNNNKNGSNSNSNDNHSTTMVTTGVSPDFDDEEDEEVIHDNVAGGSGVKMLEVRVKLQQREIMRKESKQWNSVRTNHGNELISIMRVITQESMIKTLFDFVLVDGTSSCSDSSSSTSTNMNENKMDSSPNSFLQKKKFRMNNSNVTDTNTDIDNMDIVEEEQETTTTTTISTLTSRGEEEQRQLTQQHHMTSLLRLYSKILMACPPGNGNGLFGTSNGGSSGAKGSGSGRSVSQSILFTLTSERRDVSIVNKLWSLVQEYFKTDNGALLVRPIVENRALGVTSSTTTSLQSQSQQSQSHQLSGSLYSLFILCSTLSHQLLSMDDSEFFQQQKSIDLSTTISVITHIREWLYRNLWLQGTLELTPISSDIHLNNLQIILAVVNVYNQLLFRNERRPFIANEEWLWRGISERDIGIDSDDIENSSNSSSGGGGIIRFKNPRMKTVLSLIPQVIPFTQRVEIFQQLVAADKKAIDPTPAGVLMGTGIKAKVRRTRLVQDAFDELNNQSKKIKSRIYVSFVSEQGVEEAGIDGGGLFKEFMDNLSKQAFDPHFGLFNVTSTQVLVPNPSSVLSAVGEYHLQYFGFLGRILGKALYERILIESQFAGVFLNALLGRQNTIDDMIYLDEQVYRSLMMLKQQVANGEDIADLGIFFVANTEFGGRVYTTELIPGGSDILVNKDNFTSYMCLLANFKLNLETRQQSRALLDGCRDVVPVHWLRMFGPHELQLLIGGDRRRIDIDDMRVHSRYGGGYHESQPYVQAFWAVVAAMSVEEQGDLLKFVTSCSRQPLLGFRQLNPLFCVQKVPKHETGEDTSAPSRLPMAATCMNLLKLPEYETIEELREKLLYAIKSNSGFELS
eukprot:gene5732-11590_t